MQTSTSKTVSVKLDQKIRDRIDQIAKSRDRTAHWIMREAINQYIDKEEKHEAFRKDTVDAWNEYKKTGLHATAEEVEAWLNTWGTDNELPVPVCHK